MLKMLMAGFAAIAGRETRNKHTIVVDDLDADGGHHDIAILDIAVGDSFPLKKGGDLEEFGTGPLKGTRIIKILVQLHTQRVALDPVHAYNRKCILANFDSRSLKVEANETAIT
jgi:hypothetical protein